MDKTPLYNLKVVVQQTKIKPDTLRAWERRYGLPAPARTEGGHRLYSDYDIAIVKWLLARQKEGLSIRKAIHLWQEKIESGHDPLLTQAHAPSVGSPDFQEDARRFIGDWINAVRNFDESTVNRLFSAALAHMPQEVVVTEILLKGMREIGREWFKSDLSVQHEHFASGLVQRQLTTLIASAPAPYRRERILVACPPQEEHTMGLLALTLFLRNRGWDVVYLGADVPVNQINDALETISPSLVILSSTSLISASRLKTLSHSINQKVPVAFGGRIFDSLPNIKKTIPGFYLGNDLLKAPEVISNLLSQSFSPEHYLPDENPFRTLTSQIEAHRSKINVMLYEMFADQGDLFEFISIANHYFLENLIAALRLGNLELLNEEVSWIRGLLLNRHMVTVLLVSYFKGFQTVIEDLFPEDGEPINEFLNHLL